MNLPNAGKTTHLNLCSLWAEEEGGSAISLSAVAGMKGLFCRA